MTRDIFEEAGKKMPYRMPQTMNFESMMERAIATEETAEKKRKFVCVDCHDIPVVAVVDPDMMSTMPWLQSYSLLLSPHHQRWLTLQRNTTLQ